MSLAGVEEPPRKKRKFFFADNSLSPPEETPPANPPPQQNADALPESSSYYDSHVTVSGKDCGHFDKSLFESFVGEEVPRSTVEQLRDMTGDDMERAINMYLDGSWKDSLTIRPTSSSVMDSSAPVPSRDAPRPKPPDTPDLTPSKEKLHRNAMPGQRYVGAFGVEAWATRSGTVLVKPGETVNIERTKSKSSGKAGRGGRAAQTNFRARADIIVRITNFRSEEIGRLPKETAQWVSTLVDQKVCRFEGTCVFAPDRIRVNDSIFLQLRCSLLKRAFEAGNFVKPEDNRTTGFFEEKETSEEKDLRLRQVALVKLFNEVNLHPSTTNDTTAKHKRQGILQAAEIAEQYDKEAEKKPKPTQDGNSPPGDEEEEEGKELEQDQLDTLYKKAQSFDFDTPTLEPPDTFSMSLRKYQKQALHWMVGKEKDERSDHKEASMHPLWEEYDWPVKDMDDHDLPTVTDQSHFYVNPYSGELSLDFPVQEQHCLGGILADGEFVDD